MPTSPPLRFTSPFKSEPDQKQTSSIRSSSSSTSSASIGTAANNRPRSCSSNTSLSVGIPTWQEVHAESIAFQPFSPTQPKAEELHQVMSNLTLKQDVPLTYHWNQMPNQALQRQGLAKQPESEQMSLTPRRYPSASQNASFTATPYSRSALSSPESYKLETPPTSVSASLGSVAPTSSVERAQREVKELRLAGSEGFAVSADTPEIVGRYLMISPVPKNANPQDLQECIGAIAAYKTIIVKHLVQRGCIFVTFHDPREAFKLYQALRTAPVWLSSTQTRVQLDCMKVEKRTVETAIGQVEGHASVLAMSQSCVSIELIGGEGITLNIMQDLMRRFGDVMSLDEIVLDKKFIVEFWDTQHAAEAVSAIHDRAFNNSHIIARLHDKDDPAFNSTQSTYRPSMATQNYTLGSAAYRPGVIGPVSPEKPSVPRLPETPARPDAFWSPPSSNTTAHSSATSSRFPLTPNASLTSSYRSSPSYQGPNYKHRSFPGGIKVTPGYTGFSSPTGSPGYSNRAFPQPYEVYKPYGYSGAEQYDRKRVPEQNVVRQDRILSGLDPRTTVMIKDVPNKLSRNELVDVLNSAVPGGFDFVYLRFDFRNHCNVGYAFVNFIDVKSLFDFHMAKVGRKWNLFSSEKVLQVCYATIQGKENLINKFRNSAVMDVIEEWRPQIFYSSGTYKGRPEPFPDADNPVQKQRSYSARLSSLSSPTPSYDQHGADQYYDFAPSAYDKGF